jgi:plasmid maintenance system antidote protein VapI
MNEQWVTGDPNDPDVDVLSESALAMAQATLQNAIDGSGISRADLARKLDAPRSFVTRILSGSHNLTIKTMARCLAACGYEIQFGVKPIQWNWAATEVRPTLIVDCNSVPSIVEGTALPGTLLLTSTGLLAAECPLA